METAEGYYDERLSISRERKQVPGMARSKLGLSRIAESRGYALRAVSLLGVCAALLEILHGSLPSGIRSDLEQMTARTGSELDKDAWALARA
jgi:hypothetical protein